MTKKQAQAELDRLRKDKRSFHRGTPQYERRLHLETVLDQHLYEKGV
jgi:hypothetical protein